MITAFTRNKPVAEGGALVQALQAQLSYRRRHHLARGSDEAQAQAEAQEGGQEASVLGSLLGALGNVLRAGTSGAVATTADS